MTREKFLKNLSNLHFPNNEEALPREHADHDRAIKVRWQIDDLNESFSEAEVKQSVGEHMVKCRGKSIMRQHIKNKLIKWGYTMWSKCAPKKSYLYESNK